MSLCVDDLLVCKYPSKPCIPDGHLHRVTYTRCRIDTINSVDDGHIAVRNMYRIEINIHEKELCVKLVIYKHQNEMHDQQNIKFYSLVRSFPQLHKNSAVHLLPISTSVSYTATFYS